MFAAKVPHTYMTLSMTYTIYNKDEQNSIDLDIKQRKEVEVHLKEELRLWLENNCVGKWQINPKQWQIEFDNETDYVNYSLIWYGK